MRIRGREQNGRRPREPELHVVGRVPAAGVGPGRDVANLVAARVEERQRAVVAARDDQGVVEGDRPHPAALRIVAADVEPVLAVDAAPAARRDAERPHVLLAAEKMVGKVAVGGHVVELPDRQVVALVPRAAAVHAQDDALVVALDHARRVPRVDPQVVVVAAGDRDLRERAAAVGRAPERVADDVDDVGIGGMREDLGEVPGARVERMRVARLRPRRAAVV